jgi:alkaline phosphatase D
MSLSRRDFLRHSSVAALFGCAPGIIKAQGARPALPYGVAAGVVNSSSAVIWSRADRAARMVVEYSTTERFADARSARGGTALPANDYTSRVVLTRLPAGQRIFYRVRCEDLADARASSEPVTGHFTTAPAQSQARDLTIVWSADTAGQGWGINEEWGGMRLYETMRRVEPDLFVHAGDTVYADGIIPAEVTLDDGRVWRNIVTEAKSRVAQTLDDFRGNYQYNLLDANLKRFNADVAQVAIWDDHEVRDNWWKSRELASDSRYAEKSMAVLSARAKRAFLEYNPLHVAPLERGPMYRKVPLGSLVDVFVLDMRSYRAANSDGRQDTRGAATTLFGNVQLQWLKAGIAASRAAWKVVVCSIPLGLVVPDAPDRYDAVANAEPGAPLGRELEVADLLRFLQRRRARGVVWITGDVHYCAAHHYDPARARFTEFDPFWEFVAGPLNAGTFGPGTVDPTFGPEVKFVGIPAGMKPNRPPLDGYQFFGKLQVQARTRALVASLHNLTGDTIFSIELPPE